MTQTTRYALVLLFIPSLGVAGPQTYRTTLGANERHSLFVRVYNHAGVPDEALQSARRQASHLVTDAGLELTWVGCPTSRDERANYPTCMGLRPTAQVLQVHILDRMMTDVARRSQAECGESILTKDGGFGQMARVFYPCVVLLAEKRALPESIALGHILAHEIGHLLLGHRSHSRTGIMAGHWEAKQLRQAREGMLRFTRNELTRMRGNAIRRIRMAESAGPNQSHGTAQARRAISTAD